MSSAVLSLAHSSDGRGESLQLRVEPSPEIVFDDAVTIRGMGKLEAQYLGVLFRLLQSISRVL
jgi:hypothetical protein